MLIRITDGFMRHQRDARPIFPAHGKTKVSWRHGATAGNFPQVDQAVVDSPREMQQRYKMFAAPSTSRRDVASRVRPFNRLIAILNYTGIYRSQTATITSEVFIWNKGVSL